MKIISRLVAIFAIMMLASTALFAAGQGEQEQEGPVTMTYWYPWGGDSETWDLWRIGEFEKEHPDISVDPVYVPEDGGLSNGKLLAAIAGGTPPDVVVSNSAPLAYSLATQGALAPLDEVLERAGFSEEDLLPPFLDLMKYEDTTYIFPHDSNVSLFYYNVDLFEQAGLDPNDPPQTIAEVDEYADALAQQADSGGLQRLGFIPWIDGGNDSLLWGWLFGHTFYYASENRISLATPELESAFEWMQTYAEQYDPERIQSFTSGFGGAFSPDHPFFTGKVAMTVNGNWFSNAIKLYAPELNYRTAKIPAPDYGRPGATTFGTNVFLMPRGADAQAAAVEFMLFASQPEISADNINTWRSISVWDKEVPQVVHYENNDPIYETVLELARNPESGHPALTSVATQLADGLLRLRDDVIYNGTDPLPLLEELEAELQEELD